MKNIIIENRATFIARLQKHTTNQSEIDNIMYVYDLSKAAHRPQVRDTGERYFEHPREGVIIMLDELNWYDVEAIIGFLLHDVGEDAPIFGNRTKGYDQFVKIARARIEKSFSPSIANLVIALTKPGVDGIRFTDKKSSEAFYHTQMMENLKALALKMIDRLHNLRTLPGCTKEKQKSIVKETKEVYFPIFATLTNTEYKDLYERISKKIGEALNILETPQQFEVICQKWEESELGWGVRPDGYSLHLSMDDRKSFIKAYWDSMPGQTPDEYSRPSGVPYTATVDQKTYDSLVAKRKENIYGLSKNGYNYPKEVKNSATQILNA